MLIYIADDEKLPLELLKDEVEEAIDGAEPICFNNPEDLLSAVKKQAPDMIFLDINMPKMSGIEVTKEINGISPATKIIFVTGHSEFAAEAFEVYASGYIMKPCRAENIKKIMEKLDFPQEKEKDIFIKTFGNFDVFYKGEPIYFRSPKSKELLAYLVDREGSLISRQEMASIIFEDDFSRSAQVRLSKFATRLQEDLEKYGIGNLFINDNGYRVDLSLAECDLIEYLKGSEKYLYTDEYMEQYSFGEYRKGSL